MTKLAIIGASYLQLPLVRRAKEMGLYTICFAWADGAVCKDECDSFYPISIIEKEQILNICRKEQINGICTIASDTAAPTVAYVAEQMGLVGNSYECALKANDKYLMRNAFMEAGIPCPLYQMVKSEEEELNNAFTYPLIIKPTDRSGSLAVTKVSDVIARKYALREALKCSFKHEAIIEEFIEGREISVEFISYQGKHYPLQITDKVTTEAPHFVELEHHQPADLSAAQYDEIYALTDRALTALGVTNGASHSEYRITEDGKIYVMEIGARMGGDFIGSDLVQLSTGYDFLRGVIEVALGQFTPPERTINKYTGVYFLCAETGYLELYFQQLPSCIVAHERTKQTLSSVTCSGDRSGYMIYQSDKKLVL